MSIGFRSALWIAERITSPITLPRLIPLAHFDRFAGRVMTEYLSINGRPSVEGTIQFFHDQRSTALCQDEAVSQ